MNAEECYLQRKYVQVRMAGYNVISYTASITICMINVVRDID